MSLPTHILDRIPAELRKSGMLRLSAHSQALTTGASASALAASASEVAHRERHSNAYESSKNWQDEFLAGRFIQGGVVELCAEGGAALGTTMSLRACRAAQQKSFQLGGQKAWCAFVDPTESLYAPGVKSAGVDLTRLLVVQPDEESLSRVVLRLVESKVFPLVVIDTMGLPGAPLEVSLSAWVRVVRRLNIALEGSERTVILMTDKNARRPLPLPVAQRIELSRASARDLLVSVPKDSRQIWGGRGPVPARLRVEQAHAS